MISFTLFLVKSYVTADFTKSMPTGLDTSVIKWTAYSGMESSCPLELSAAYKDHHHWAFGIAFYGMPGIMENTLQFIWFWPISCVNPILRGSHLLPSQFPGKHTAMLPHMVHSTLRHLLSWPVYLTLEELETLWLGVNLMVNRWCLMCTNHIDMTAHTPAFF